MSKHGRIWNEDLHVEAGYDRQEWGPVPTADHELIGKYEGTDGQSVEVRYVPKGVSGNPEFEIEWADGHKVTVLDDSTAIRYLIESGAAEIEA